MLLDTSFLIDLFEGQEEAFEKGLGLVNNRIVQRVPSPVVMELSYGVMFGDEDERRHVQNALLMYPVVPLTDLIAHRAGQLLGQADIDASGDSGIGKIDAMVAAVADQFDEPVLTSNVNDFDTLGVPVENY